MALKRQQIIDAIVTRLKLINGAGGYYLNLNSRVYDNRVPEYADNEIPAVNITDGDEESNQELLAGSVNYWYRDLNIGITLIVNGTLAAADVRKGIADIQLAISTDLKWSALAIDTIWTGTTIDRNQEEKKIMSATVNITVRYSTTEWLES